MPEVTFYASCPSILLPKQNHFYKVLSFVPYVQVSPRTWLHWAAWFENDALLLDMLWHNLPRNLKWNGQQIRKKEKDESAAESVVAKAVADTNTLEALSTFDANMCLMDQLTRNHDIDLAAALMASMTNCLHVRCYF